MENPININNKIGPLNVQQKNAVLHQEGPCLVLAGAGTGKTRVLVSRTVNSILNYKENILLVTFTNKAAREMAQRVSSTLGKPTTNLWIGTFHSICTRILRVHAQDIGISNDFTIIDSEDQLKLVKQILQSDFPKDKEHTKRFTHLIQRFKDQALNPENIPDTIEPSVIKIIYKQYQNRLHILNTLDFGDLILCCINLFKKRPEILEKYQKIFEYIMVDEYQDTNTAQYLWLRLLAQSHGNIFCVGDEDQSIYAWRGAEITNILRFDKDFPNAKVIRLEQNYRSTHHVISLASGLISNNKNRLGKHLFSETQNDEKVIIHGAWDTDDEARLVCEFIQKQHHNKVPLSEIAILVRASFQTREFEERLLKIGLPYHIVGGIRFYERQEIKDIIAYLRVIIQPDDGLAFERILNIPKRNIGLTSIRRVHEIANRDNISFTEAAKTYSVSEGKQPSKIALLHFFHQINLWRQSMHDIDHVQLTQKILDESGYTKMWQENKVEGPTRLENLKELINAMKSFENLQTFLDHVSLVTDNRQNNQEEGVQIMTLHAAKGLEFDSVFLPGWEEGLFPHQKSIAENGDKGLEEERRLAYVGISRARKYVCITYTMQRRYYHSWQTNIPSRFIKELPQEHFVHFNPNGIEIHKPPEEDFIVGERVFHEKYGHGDIIDLDPYGLYIKFDYAGIKKIAQRFVAKAS